MNAKDLALAKINAGSKMFGFYAYGISLGMDIRTLASIINTPQGRAISKLCEGNVLNGLMGAFSALQAIKKLEGQNLYHDLTQFDIIGIENVSDDTVDRSQLRSGVVVNNEQKKTASELVQALFEAYYTTHIEKDVKALAELKLKPNVYNNGLLNFSKTLSNMLYQIGILGKIDDCLAYITSQDNPLWQEALKGIKDLENAVEWKASVHLLLEYCKKYGDLVDTYYQHDFDHYYARDLKILAQGAEEMRVLGSILSSNKGVKSRTEEGTAFIKTIENAIIDRKKQMDLKPKDDDRIDFILFCIDKKYREDAIRKYEEVKHSINILDVVATAPHFLSYLRTCCIPYAAFKVGSAKFRARDRYYDLVVSELGVSKSSDKEGVIRGIENAVNFRMLQEWLAQEQMLFFLPEGSTMFVGRDQEVVTTKKDLYIPLFDKDGNGLATFKYYMEHTIIPGLISNPHYTNNAFIHGLTPFELTKTGTHAAVPAYTLSGNMMPYTESELVLLENYQADFSTMYGINFPGSLMSPVNTIPSYADAFYIYSQYVFGGKKGQKSLMALFDDNECGFALKFRALEAQVDLEGDFEFDLMDLVKWCAPNGNPYHPSTDFFYAPSMNRYGKELQEKKKEDTSVADEGADTQTGKKKQRIGLVETSPTAEGRQNYLTPTMNQLMMGENSYKLGQNTRIADQLDLNNIVLDQNNPEESIALITNSDAGVYTLVANDYLSERSQKILNLLNKNLQGAYTYIYNAEDGTYLLSIDRDGLQALIQEAINEIDENC